MTLTSNQKKGLAVGAALAGGVALLLLLPKKTTAASSRITALTLTPIPSSGLAPLSVVFSGSATDVNNAPVSGARLYFFVGGVLIPGSVPTDANGLFEFQYTFDQPGTYICTIGVSPNFAALSASTGVTV